MLINLRNALMAGKRLPYDAEVEYLESTGTQWIDTGIVPNSTTEFELTFAYVEQSGQYNRLFGTQKDGVGKTLTIRSSAQNGGSFYFETGSNVGSNIASFDTKIHTISLKGGSLTFDGNAVLSNKYPSDAITSSMWLWGNNDVQHHSKASVYSSKIWQSGVLVQDFIPVREGTVGYLYDRVSGKLFGNAGTGSFVVGPDLSARSYVQSGLVAMWDGIENAGLGVHDASESKWKDLVGNYDFNLNSSATINSNHIYCDGRQSAGDAGVLIDVPVVTIEIVAQYLSSSANTAIFMTGGSDSYYYMEVFAISASNTSFIFSYHNVDWKDTVVHSWSKNLGNTDCYKDGVNIGTKGTATLDVSSARGYIGRIGGTGNVGCQCRIYSIRLYSRALTAAEIAANYAIDKARFNLPDAT